jgi:crotonobetainyl-CoA:carnitine CoA-transferase CaiB-like acyl-CoA transferase
MGCPSEGQGNGSGLLDLRTSLPRAQELLERADLLVTDYRPGAIEAHGPRTPPGIIRARINAWGDAGPWLARRGFDSIAPPPRRVRARDGTLPGDALQAVRRR